MALITKGTVTKGTPAPLTLNKSALAAVSKVSLDSYFSNMNNWQKVDIYYKSSSGGQVEIVEFDTTKPEPQSIFSPSDKSRDLFDVQRVVIHDFDGGSFPIERNELDVVKFDMGLKVPKIVAPASKVSDVESQSKFTLADATGFEVGYVVRLFDAIDNEYGSDVSRVITDITGNVITVSQPFTDTITANRHYLRFALYQHCSEKQRTDYQFVL